MSSPLVLDPHVSDRLRAHAILRSNLGFEGEDLEHWAAVAVAEQFQPMPAIPVTACPDCGRPSNRVVGRYVSWSTLMRLKACDCGLFWASARIDATSTAWHFDHAYASEDYYATDRRDIFEQLASLVAETPLGGRVLDIGGAGGQLAKVIQKHRPDLAITVQDVSQQKLDVATLRGFATVRDWFDLPGGFDTIILSDAIYYEPNLPALWSALERLLVPGGLMLLRIPNRVTVVTLAGLRQRWTSTPLRLQGHNPDHLFICTRAYLTRKLQALGCSVQWLPSPIGEGGRKLTLAYHIVQAVHRVTGVCLTPSHVVVARKLR